MQLVPVDDSNRLQVLDFLACYEAACVTLTESTRRKAGNIFAITDNDGTVKGVISARHTLLHCLPGIHNKAQAVLLKPLLSAFLQNRKISCIHGDEAGSMYLLRILAAQNRNPASVNSYMLMTLPQEKQTQASVLPYGWRVIHCHEKDADALMKLQSAYEKEEVLPGCRTFMAALVRQNLEHLLRREYVLSLRTDRCDFIAKVNSNAIGINYVQIGGVYTAPEYRGRGYASLLVKTLVHKIYAVKKQPVLFVKKTNTTALHLYTSLGFIKSGNFLIAYL
jgi:GNAT superfamily N-acetyltransferase